jgi:hypothetical protein
MSEASTKWSVRVLDPMERLSEVLFGLIMVLTITGSLSIAIEDRLDIRALLIGAIGCNLAWGIIDAGMYLMARINETGRNILMVRTVRTASPDAAYRTIAEALPPLLASALTPEQLELMRQKLLLLPEPPQRPQLDRRDGLGALAVFLLVFLSTFPVVIPFLFVGDPRSALRASNAVAIVMLFLCGYAFGRCAGLRPWLMGLLMIAIGIALVGIAVALGG